MRDHTDRDGVIHSDYPDLELSNQNVWQYIYPHIKKWGNLTALVGENKDEIFTYSDLLDKSLRWAKELKKFFKGSVPPRVAFMMPNNTDCIPFIWGCFAVGATLCLIRHDSAGELLKVQLDQMRPDVLVTETSHYATIQKSIKDLGFSPCIYIRGYSPIIGIEDFCQVLQSGDCLDVNEAGNFEPSATLMILYSSGTTGNPKGIVLSHRSQVQTIESYTCKYFKDISQANEGEQETVICNVPFAHMCGIQYFCIVAPMSGSRIVYYDFKDELSLTEYVKKYKTKFLVVRPDTLDHLLTKPDSIESLGSLRRVMTAGSPPNVASLKRVNQKLGNKIIFHDCYGLTECSTILKTPVGQTNLEMTGKLTPNCKAKLIDVDTGEIIREPHQMGEILFKGPGMMDGYLDNPEATAEAVDKKGWFHTGDIGFFDENHFFKVIDRFKDIITITIGGKKKRISPSQIESILKTHQSVLDAGVIGIPDIKTGQEIPKAFIVTTEAISAEVLINFVAENAPEECKLSGGVEFVKTLPRNHFGKLIKKVLREMTWYK